ncbi:MAG: pseudouridine synthase [Akkermansiaceae bacterium]
MKLIRFLFHHASCGKKEARRLLASGQVRIDGCVEKDPACEVGDFTSVMLGDAVLRAREAVYIMLYKPAGYLSATEDAKLPTVMELIDESEGLHLAGRLDRASTGLLLLTNDGKWSRLITEPKEGVPKVYLIDTAEPITPETAQHFQEGIYFAYEDMTTQPAELDQISARQARLTIYEGKYHQIKRMFHAVGNRVTALHRLRVGNIQLDPDLVSGSYRHLTPCEVRDVIASEES